MPKAIFYLLKRGHKSLMTRLGGWLLVGNGSIGSLLQPLQNPQQRVSSLGSILLLFYTPQHYTLKVVIFSMKSCPSTPVTWSHILMISIFLLIHSFRTTLHHRPDTPLPTTKSKFIAGNAEAASRTSRHGAASLPGFSLGFTGLGFGVRGEGLRTLGFKVWA